MTEFLFYLSGIALLYIYIGYYYCLVTIAYFCQFDHTEHKEFDYKYPPISIIVAAHNEEESIEKRILNLLYIDYPGEVEIIIASDGSTDKTVAIASKYEDSGIRIFNYPKNRGRAAIHNETVLVSKGEIIISTDAETEFEIDFLKEIIKPFQNENVGCTVGILYFRDKESGINKSENFYWKWEVCIRSLQDKIGLLMTGSGACTAFKKKLFKPLSPIDDIDFATTIDVILQGEKVRFIQSAIAYDEAPSKLKKELNVRFRSSKRIVGTLKRWGLKNWFRHPLYSWTLLSHKILRWLSPFFIIMMFITNLMLLGRIQYNIIFIIFLISTALSVIGALGHFANRRIPVASIFFSFFVANLGFLIGMINALLGRVPEKY